MMRRSSVQRRMTLGCLCIFVAITAVDGFWKKKKKTRKSDAPVDEETRPPVRDGPYTACDIFVAPSSRFGWGVYAARNFRAAELVEIVPAYLPLESQGVEIQSSILYDYVHTSGCGPDSDEEEESNKEKDQLLLGHGSSYNHNDNPNIQFVEYGRGKGHVVAVQALRNISMGEELLARYGDDDWFTNRNIAQKQIDSEATLSSMDIPSFKEQYCSKVHAGIGSKTWTDKVLPNVTINFWFNAHERLPPKDAGLGVARAKVALQAGDRIEMSLGLLVSQRIMADSIVAPLLFSWKDLSTEQQRELRMLRKNFRDQFVVHYPGHTERYDAFDSYEDLAILPIGALAMVRRMGASSSSSSSSTEDNGSFNCQLKIRGSMQSGSSSLALELVATSAIAQGQVLLLDMPPAGTRRELELLETELRRTGQPYHASTYAATKLRDEL